MKQILCVCMLLTHCATFYATAPVVTASTAEEETLSEYQSPSLPIPEKQFEASTLNVPEPTNIIDNPDNFNEREKNIYYKGLQRGWIAGSIIAFLATCFICK